MNCRGWTVYPYPVALEPTFQLPRHLSEPSRCVRDDGRVPGLIELPFRTVGWLLGRLISRSSKRDSTGPLQAAAQSQPELTTLILLPRGGESVSPRSWQRLLLALPSVDGPVHLELQATDGMLALALYVEPSMCDSVTGLLTVHAPELAVLVQEDGLAQAWEEREALGALVLEFGLARSFTRPLAGWSAQEPDPLASLFAAMSSVQGSELAVLQMQFQVCQSRWDEVARASITASDYGSLFVDAPETARLAREKFSSPLFAVSLRLGIKAASADRAADLAGAVARGLLPLARPDSNHLIPLDDEPGAGDDVSADLLLRQSRRTGMLLSSAELASLLHPPAAELNLPDFVRVLSNTRSAPDVCQGDGVLLGLNDHAGQVREVRLPDSLRNSHVHLIGASGSGKSTLMLQMLLQDLEAGRGACLIDPHGDLCDDLLARMPHERHQDLILVDPADPDYVVPFNVLHASSDLERQLLSSDLVAVFRRLSTSWGDRMNSVLANAVLAFLESSVGGTLLDLRRFLIEKAFREQMLETLEDAELRHFWQREYPQMPRGAASPVLTRLDALLRHKLVRHMVAARHKSLDLRAAMDSSKLLVIRLSQGAIGMENASLLGALFVSRLQQAAQSRQDLPEEQRSPFTLYLDEFHNYLTPSMAAMLSGARKYRLGLVLAHQDLSQLGGRESGVLGAAVSNPATRICFRLGDKDSRALAGGFAHFERSDLHALSVGEAICRVQRSDQDFNVRTAALPNQDADGAASSRQAAVDASRRFAVPRSEVEAVAVHGDAAPPPAVTREPRSAGGVSAVAATSKAEKPKTEARATSGREQDAGTVTPAEPGRGKDNHKYWQTQVRQEAQEAGWQARVEAALPDKGGYVDVLLQRENRSVGVEISISTSAAQELDNVRKCLDAKLDAVLCMVSEESTKDGLTKQLDSELTKSERERVLVEGLQTGMLRLAALLASHAEHDEARIRGYVVKTERAHRSADRRLDGLAELIKRLWRAPRRD